MKNLTEFRRHYLKVSGKTCLSLTEEFFVKQLFEFVEENGSTSKVVLGQVTCPCCQTNFPLPVDLEELVHA